MINVISLAGIVATPGQAVYAASKHAAMAFTLSTLFDLRRGGHRGINICAVCPSGVWTPLVGNRIDDPEAAASFTAPLLTADVIGRVVGRLTERPRTPPPGDDRAAPAGSDDALRGSLPSPLHARGADADAGRPTPTAALQATHQEWRMAVTAG
ncbi:SDR family NAD(P)-dependent oxidoreductase [Parafrankia sp. FMc6]|uniref:SDR family NAD(P)-dependent oxidoreductase n=1 Tax=Parafrankia soli TaxID=2599596 RepID=UPI0034D554B5